MKKAAADLAAKLAPEDAMNFETIDGRALHGRGGGAIDHEGARGDPDAAIFWRRKAGLVEGGEFFRRDGRGPSCLGQGSAGDAAAGPGGVDGTSVTLLISASGIHKGRVFSKALLKLAQAKNFDLPDLRNT